MRTSTIGTPKRLNTRWAQIQRAPFAMALAVLPAAKIAALNQWLAAFARQRGLTYVDYTPVLANATGGLRADLTRDGVHPNKAGYDLIEPLALKAIAQARKTQASKTRAKPTSEGR